MPLPPLATTEPTEPAHAAVPAELEDQPATPLEIRKLGSAGSSKWRKRLLRALQTDA